MLQNLHAITERGLIAPEVAIIVPTFNERDNVVELVRRIDELFSDVAWEIVFVDDDSQDQTPDIVYRMCRSNPHIRMIRRLGRRGLSSAVVEGILSTSAPFIAVMDADLQHDETLLPMMHALLRDSDTDIVVGSRYVAGGGVGNWAQSRQRISRWATSLSQLIVKAPLSDPMSGFFMLRRDVFENVVRRLSLQGYKILLDIVASSSKPLRIEELPYVFRPRTHGESKLDALVALEYLQLLLDKTIGRWIPVRFIMFGAIGGLGIVVHMVLLAALLYLAEASFLVAQSAASIAAMTGNFFLNNLLTYRDKRLKGLGKVLVGLLSFYAVCSFGGVANVGVANVMFGSEYSWWASALAGILVGAVWNYAVSSVFTWPKN